MGGVSSRVNREEPVRRCRERKRLMKLLLASRRKFAAAFLAYLQSLRNVGATLRQLAEADSSITLPRGNRPLAPLSPPASLPPPPPLPPFSPDEVRSPPNGIRSPPSEDGEFPLCDALGLPFWVETTKGNLTVEETLGRSLPEIVREIDEFFLKASAAGSGVATLLEPRRGSSLEEIQGKKLKSAKVFSSQSWRWYVRSPPLEEPTNAHPPHHHSSTLERLLAEERKLYKQVKGEEAKKAEFGKKVALLRKQEAGAQDWTISEKTRSSMEMLQKEIVSLNESITATCSSISTLRDGELLPQILELCSRLAEMWQCMHDCHEGQNTMAKQMGHLKEILAAPEPTCESHIEAAAQLEAELEVWHRSFHRLLRAQKEYVDALGRWVRLANCLPPTSQRSEGAQVTLLSLCEDWLLCVDRLLDKIPLETIKSFISRVQSIKSQLFDEQQRRRKSTMMEKKLTRKLGSPTAEEKDIDGDDDNNAKGRTERVGAKMEAKRKRLEEEKGKYMNSVLQSRTMIIEGLQSTLPDMFQALMGFTSVGAHAFDRIQKLEMDGRAVDADGSSM